MATTATSCEPNRCSAYSDDLRWRIVYKRTNLCVDVSTVCRTVRLFERTGNVSKKKFNATNLPRKLTDFIQLLILQLVLQHVGINLTEIRRELLYLSGVDLSESTICQFLHKHNFSRQRIRLVATQRDECLRQTYAGEVSMYKAHMIVFVDETGTDARDKIRKYAYGVRGKPPYGVRGKPPVAQKLLIRGQHFSSIAIMSTAGILDFQVVTGSVTGDVFKQFVQNSILPLLMPFNGTNKHSIVVMDNASIHHVHGITELIQGVGAIPLFLPPYSPDFNPIEELFSKLKTTIKMYEFQDVQRTELDFESIIYSAFCHITSEDCKG